MYTAVCSGGGGWVCLMARMATRTAETHICSQGNGGTVVTTTVMYAIFKYLKLVTARMTSKTVREVEDVLSGVHVGPK